MSIWYILWSFWHIFGMSYQEKSGNPEAWDAITKVQKEGSLLNARTLAFDT
jgi:hypothetical protein